MNLDPLLAVLFWGTVAAGASALGALPRAVLGRLPASALGWANALAAGLMLGVAYLLLSEGMGDRFVVGTAGAVLGLVFVRLTHALSGTEDLDLNALDELSPEYGYRVVAVNTLHSAYEGVAIGAAMLLSIPFGVSMAVALALHNVPEAMVLTEVLAARGVRLVHAAALAVSAKATQVLMGVTLVAVGTELPGLVPIAVGFGAGSLLQLLLAELLPESYRQVGHTSIALVALLAMGMVVGLGGLP